MGKTRKVTEPYEIWQAGDRTWLVLKKYQADDNKEYARALCAVYTPMTGGGFDLATMKPTGSCDMGDTYIADYKSVATRIFRDPTLPAE